jgi:hypothetical protein
MIIGQVVSSIERDKKNAPASAVVVNEAISDGGEQIRLAPRGPRAQDGDARFLDEIFRRRRVMRERQGVPVRALQQLVERVGFLVWPRYWSDFGSPHRQSVQSVNERLVPLIATQPDALA